MIAIDLGASKIRIAEVQGIKIANKIVVKTPDSKQKIIGELFKLIDHYKNQAIGVSIAGFVKNGIVIRTPNMDFNNVALEKILKAKYNVGVKIENDANCAGLAELKYGVIKGKKNAVLITLSTGIGGAIFINGQLYRGQGFAGEPGHMIIDNKTFEQLASGRNLKLMARKQGLHINTSYELPILAGKGDKKAKHIFEIYGEMLGKGISNTILLLDPEIVVLGGGLSAIDNYMPSLIRTIRKYDKINRNTKIVRARFRDDAGLIGAASLL